MNSRKNMKKDQSEIQSQGEQRQHKAQQKKLSEYRDYISMKASNHLNKTKKNPKKKQPEKHSLRMHAHLQPEQQPEDDEDIEPQSNADPIALMANYTTEEYRKFIEVMKERVQCQKPKTDVSQELLDALALRDCNVCIYGFGSKIDYVRHLMENYLCDHNIWEVNGYRQGITDKKVYNNFGKFLQSVKILNKSSKIIMEDQLKQYRECLAKYSAHNKKQIIVVFHCIDSINFMNSDSQRSLSQLFSLPKIKLICTVDSIKIASVWSPQTKTSYNLSFFHLNTHIPNIREQLFRPNATDLHERQQQSLTNIYNSLNNNQKRILKLFAKRQLQNDNKQQLDQEYYTLDTLLQQCIDNVILSSDTQLRENLLELVDHKVVVVKERVENQRVRKYYTLHCSKSLLEKIYQWKIQD